MRNCRDRTQSSGYKLKEGTFRLGVGKTFLTLKVATQLEQVVWGSCGCPNSGSIGLE